MYASCETPNCLSYERNQPLTRFVIVWIFFSTWNAPHVPKNAPNMARFILSSIFLLDAKMRRQYGVSDFEKHRPEYRAYFTRYTTRHCKGFHKIFLLHYNNVENPFNIKPLKINPHISTF